MDREGVPDVVYSGAGLFAVMDMALSQQMPESLIHRTVVQTAGSLVDKEGRVGRSWRYLRSFMHVLLQSLAGGITQGHPAGLSELSFGYIEPFCSDVEIFQVQGRRLADTDPRAIEKAQKGVVGVRPKGVFRWQFKGCRH